MSFPQVLDGVNSGMFLVSPNGEVSVSGNLDFETQKEYTIEIEVKEGNFINKTKLTINLVDIDDLGPAFIVNSSATRTDVVYISEISIYFMGEIPIKGGSILAKDTESDKYNVEYTPLTGNKNDHFTINSSSGKVSVIKKLPENGNVIVLFFKAEDISPKRLSTKATLVISLNKEPTEPSSSTSLDSSSVTPGQKQSSTDSMTSTSPTKLTPSSSVDSSSLTPGQNQTTTDLLPMGTSSSLSSSSSVTLGENQTTRDPLQNTSPTGTASLPQSQSSVKPGKDQSTANSLQSTLLSVPYTPEVTRGESEKTGKNTTDSSLIPSSTTPLGVPASEAYTTGEFFGAVGVLLLIIIILIAVILLGYCWWRKRKEDESYSEANSANTKPFAKAEYDSISKTSSKMNGVDNNAANLSDALESGQLPKEDYDSVPPPDTSNFIEKTENENLYTTFGPSIHGNAVGDSVTDDKPPIDTVVNDQLESIPTPSSFPEDVDGINDYTEVASQLSSEAPVTMTFADLGKKSNVSFADDNNLLQDDNDGEDNNQTDGLSYVEHINNGGGDDDDDHSNSANKFGEKPNEEEMTWVVADNDGNQHGQDDAEQQADEGSPEETQNQLSQNNEIAYAPLLDDSQRDSWGATNPQYENARL
ncbi:serine-rich adhesin for platelets isoform X9 [Octopus bimaculoides]|uniref:serine-rich adhesin for platelets isoform X9 n=1 Tax=Octopus bimaculoides TaxID=37653 RepID=UPI0022E18AEA|nr:serine-rich adhesin for platelets isoform X9 [Octopus bimaculoides]